MAIRRSLPPTASDHPRRRRQVVNVPTHPERVNIHPADELAAMREEIKILQGRADELRDQLLAEGADLKGDQYTATIIPGTRETLDRKAIEEASARRPSRRSSRRPASRPSSWWRTEMPKREPHHLSRPVPAGLEGAGHHRETRRRRRPSTEKLMAKGLLPARGRHRSGLGHPQQRPRGLGPGAVRAGARRRA